MEEDKDRRPGGPALKGVQPGLLGGRHVNERTSKCSDESRQRRRVVGTKGASRRTSGDFSAGLVAKTLHSQHRGTEFNPWSVN